MTGAVVSIGMVNTEVDSLKAGQSKLAISSDTILCMEGVKNDPTFDLNKDSDPSSYTLATELLEDSAEGESEQEEENTAYTDMAMPEAPQQEVKRRHSDPSGAKKEFVFGTITVREYPRGIGNTVAMMGPPIGLEWEHQDEVIYDLVEYDEACAPTRRTQSELKMPLKYRQEILSSGGYCKKDIQEAIKRSNITRNNRKRTNEMLGMMKFEFALEKVSRGLKNPLGKKKDLPY